MKKLSFGMLCALGILGSGCDLDIPNDQLGTLTNAELCSFSGGDFNVDEKTCYCGGTRCGENVTCGVDPETKKYFCLSSGNMDYPQYTCTMSGMTLCFDRIVKDESSKDKDQYKTSGYFITCDDKTNSWSTPSQCDNSYSCSTYLEHDMYYATQCGECNNHEEGCHRGTKDEAHH